MPYFPDATFLGVEHCFYRHRIANLRHPAPKKHVGLLVHCSISGYKSATFWKHDIAMEHYPPVDDLPTKNGLIPQGLMLANGTCPLRSIKWQRKS